MSRRKQANPKSLKVSIDNLKLPEDEKSSNKQVGEFEVTSRNDDKDEKEEVGGDTLLSKKIDLELDIENTNSNEKKEKHLGDNGDLIILTKNQNNETSSDCCPKLGNNSSESFLKNMTNNQLEIFEARKSSLIFAKINVDHELDNSTSNMNGVSSSGGHQKNKQNVLNKNLASRSASVNSLSDSNKSRSSSISSHASDSDDLVDRKGDDLDRTSKTDEYDEHQSENNDENQHEDERVEEAEEEEDIDVDESENENENFSGSENQHGFVCNKVDEATTMENENDENVETGEKKFNKKKNRRQRYNPMNDSNNASSHNSSSILVNGKRYYRLIFSCENCGLRYSDQSALNTHKQNYCVKRNQPPSSNAQSQSKPSNKPHHHQSHHRSSSSTTSSRTASPARSSSTSSSSSSSSSSSRDSSPSSTDHHHHNKNNNLSSNNHSLSNSPKSLRSNSPLAFASNKKTTSTSSVAISDNENKKLLLENQPTESAQFTQISNILPNSQSNIQLFKSVIYQCNNCLFQTDKKTAMNRHSRVHLAQKRKQMEELSSQPTTTTTTTTTSIATTNLLPQNDSHTKRALIESVIAAQTQQKTTTLPDGLNDKSKSYCKDCDIQFSSIKTYQHHRNNYCQKYKTIESVVPVEIASSSNFGSNSGGSETQQKIVIPKSNLDGTLKVPKQMEAPAIKVPKFAAQSSHMQTKVNICEPESIDFVKPNSSLLPTVPHMPPNAVRMGDLVYLPIFKLNGSTAENNSHFYQPRLNKDIVDENNNNNNSTKPLDLSKNSPEKFAKENEIIFPKISNEENAAEQSNLPLDLSIKSSKSNKIEIEKNTKSSFSKINFQNNPSPTTDSILDASKILNTNFLKQQQKLGHHQFSHTLQPNNSHSPPQFGSLNFFNNRSLDFPSNNFPSSPTEIYPHNNASAAAAAAAAAIFNRIQPNYLPTPSAFNLFSNNTLKSTKTQLQTTTQPPIQSKIYHCTNCQKLFFKFKLFKRHQCEQQLIVSLPPQPTTATIESRPDSNSSLSIQIGTDNKQESSKTSPILPSSSSSSLSLSSSSSESSRCSSTSSIPPLTATIYKKDEGTINKTTTSSDLLKHPLVRKTLLELYGREFDHLSLEDETMETKSLGVTKNFFMCTTCGYRGNTSRGVKQHGKMHLSAREHFGIINATSMQPYLVYNSFTDADLQTSLALAENNTTLGIKRIAQDLSVEDKQLVDDRNELSLSGKHHQQANVPTLLLNSNGIQNEDSEASVFAAQHPKKARLLEYNKGKQDEEVVNESTDPLIKIERPQTFCHKCNTQFQHVSNFLAHKKFYCKDC